MSAGRAGPGCWGIGLGLLDILVALAIAVVLVPTWMSARGSIGAFDTVTLVVGAFVSLLGILIGIRALRSASKGAKLWAVLYFLVIPLAILGLLMIQGLNW